MKKKDADFANRIIFLIGIILVLCGLLANLWQGEKIFHVDLSLVQSILISIGSSIIASGIISFLIVKYIHSYQDSLNNIVDKWGLRRIDIRADINLDINSKLEKMTEGMDIIAFGMKNFLSVKGDLLIEKLNNGCKIRILTIDPESQYVQQRESEEAELKGQISKSIQDMIKWAKTSQGLIDNKNLISVKIYNGLPQDMYQKVDDYVYTGPFLVGMPSQQTIAFSYDPNSKGADYFITYFNKLWNDTDYSEKII